jgi:hypothetical protein
MSLFAFALARAIVALLLIAAGLLWLSLRRELHRSRMDDTAAAEMVLRGWQRRRGRAWGVSLYAEKPTREITALLRAGQWRKGLPWATPVLGALAAFFFWPLLIGIALDLPPALLGSAVFCTLSGLAAAWPRVPRRGQGTIGDMVRDTRLS